MKPMFSPRGTKPSYGQSYKTIPFSKMKVNDAHPLTKTTTDEAVKAISKRISTISRSLYKHKKFKVSVVKKQVILTRTK